MRKNGYRLLRAAWYMALALWSMAALACNVPVFRYALERWEADPYHIIVFHNAPLTPEQQALLEAMEKERRVDQVNLAIYRVNVAQEMSREVRALWDAQEHPALPWIVVRYPPKTGVEPSAWSGPFNAQAVNALLESPVRRQIVQKLLHGDAVVWLLLESADKKRNEEIAQLVEAELRELEKSLALPERLPDDPPINPDLPLKIMFSTVRVGRFDSSENTLVKLLLNWNTNLATVKEPMLFPIFGRGRAVPPAIGPQIQAEAIREMAEFLTGACSCQVKEMNPGYDLLLTANWSALASIEETAASTAPPLVGISQFAADQGSGNGAGSPMNRQAGSLPYGISARFASNSPPLRQTTGSIVLANTIPAPVGQHRLTRNVAVVLGVGVAFLAVTTLVLKGRAGRTPR